jgi:hypothetical protein
MKSILDYAKEKKIVGEKNSIIERSIKTKIKEDKVVKILVKEITQLFTKLFSETKI